ncbi:hypothetical protein [Candidatus Halocynthiibacter alkanivorans]|uniref:hypothetical protein n=1 Tax=Candidatus Halocynthiibacter alkanivorans TaxID=2267619 RepID=UPI00109CFE33|nr:hypothetical protein [Candidatus Halocynthiibacter alkanivorans]
MDGAGFHDLSKSDSGQPTGHRPYPPVQKMLEKYDRLSDPDILMNRPVLLVSACTQGHPDLTGWLEALGSEVAATTDLDLALDALAENPSAWGLLVVVMDHLACEDAVVETLLLVRTVKRDLPVILASQYFSRNDFSVSRNSICDASLRTPLSKTAVELAVYAAIENNRFQGLP